MGWSMIEQTHLSVVSLCQLKVSAQLHIITNKKCTSDFKFLVSSQLSHNYCQCLLLPVTTIMNTK